MAEETKSDRKNKALVNDAADACTEMLEGLLMLNPNLTRLDGFPDIKVILRKDWDRSASQVALVSGGGSGHEPAHAGYVGQGMLTAAVCGNVFASPSVTAVLAAIREVATPAGVLLIVKNYTGDRLHFGIAAEKAKTEGIKVATVYVADDVAVDTGKITGRRGVAGTVLVHKVAGAAAEAGASLEEVAAVAAGVAEDVRSMGVASSVCTVPGQTPSDRLDGHIIELGLGIHGEPGASRSEPMSADAVADHLVQRILEDAPWHSAGGECKVLAMVNNLGASTPMEVNIITRRAVAQLRSKGCIVERLMAGPFMTALDMSGVSLSVLPLDEARLAKIDAATPVRAWGPCLAPAKPVTPLPVGGDLTAPSSHTRPTELSSQGKLSEAAIIAACNALIEAEPELTRLDTVAGDGDCGTTLKAAAEAVKEHCADHYPLNSAVGVMDALGRTMRLRCSGSSGAFYDIMCSAAEASLAHSTDAWTVAAWASAFRAAVDAVMSYGNAKPGLCTMVDALVPAAEAVEAALKANPSLAAAEAVKLAAAAAVQGANSTEGMEAAAGRASYVETDVAKAVKDAGAEAVAQWLSGAASALQA